LHDARGGSRGVPHTAPETLSPSVTRYPGTPGDPSQPLVPPRVSPRKPTRFPPETPTGARVQAYPSDLPRLRSLIRRLACNGLIPSTGYDTETGRRIGGRPPVAAETFRALLDNAEASLLRPRATKGKERAQRVDEAARVGFARLFGPRPTRLMPYRPSIEGVAARASGADRPLRRIEAVAQFCEKRIIAGFSVTDGRPHRMELVLPTMVPDLYYGWGPVVYQTTLDGDGGVAA
jgi:hypothetical protein